MFTEPIKFQSKIFSMLMEFKAPSSKDTNYLAVKFYAPIYFFAHRWLFNGTLSEQRKELFRANAYYHVRKFFTEMEVK